MTIFDLLFIVAFLTSVAMLVSVVALAARRRSVKALKLLGIWAIFAAGYFAIALGVSYLGPQRVMAAGDPWCFDDWCLTVQNVDRAPGPAGLSYEVGLRIFSRAGRVAQRAKGAWIYLIDDQGRRYSPDPDGAAVPLDVLLEPLASVVTSRRFQVPANINSLGLITGHGGPYCGPVHILVIGEGGCLFKKPSMIRIQ